MRRRGSRGGWKDPPAPPLPERKWKQNPERHLLASCCQDGLLRVTLRGAGQSAGQGDVVGHNIECPPLAIGLHRPRGGVQTNVLGHAHQLHAHVHMLPDLGATETQRARRVSHKRLPTRLLVLGSVWETKSSNHKTVCWRCSAGSQQDWRRNSRADNKPLTAFLEEDSAPREPYVPPEVPIFRQVEGGATFVGARYARLLPIPFQRGGGGRMPTPKLVVVSEPAGLVELIRHRFSVQRRPTPEYAL